MPSSAMPPPKDSSCILDYWIPPHTHLHTSYPTPDTGIPCHQGSSTGPFYPNSVNSLCLPYPMNSCHFTIMLPHPEISISIPIGQLRLHCVCVGGGGSVSHQHCRLSKHFTPLPVPQALGALTTAQRGHSICKEAMVVHLKSQLDEIWKHLGDAAWHVYE